MTDLERELSLVRLRAEAVLLQRLNAGHGFADGRTPAEIYLADPAARARIGRSPLRPRDTHAAAAAEVAAALARTEAELAASTSRLAELGNRLGLDPAQRAVLAIAAAYAIDPTVRTLCEALAPRRAPGLYAQVCAEIQPELADPAAWHRAIHPRSLLRTAGLVSLRGDDLAIMPRVVHWLLGDDRVGSPAIQVRDPGDDMAVYLAPVVIEQIERVSALCERSHVVLIQGGQGSGKEAAAFSIARAAGRRLCTAPLPEIAASGAQAEEALRDVLGEALLRDAIAYLPGAHVLAADQRTERSLVAAIDAHPDLCILAIRDLGMASLPVHRPFHLIRIVPPSLEIRREAWRRAVDGPTAETLAARYVIGPGTIAEVAHDAGAFASAAGRSPLTADVEAAVARKLTLNIGPYATRITRRARFDEMVLPEDVVTALQDMVAMVNQRSRILEGWGYGQHLGLARGVSALFSGEPGTGKTMAASAISSDLGLELFRIDLSAVVSKWVGETEKHLARIFDEAQSAEAMLLFDEADSLFGKRTEVKSSNDRYANLEINYILQRMESFDGITILTTNHEAAIDAAFMRRLNFRVRFPEPDADEREMLWRSLLPPDTGVSGVDFTSLAERFEMTGGHIRNAIVRAAVIAARHGRDMVPADLVEGAQLEYYELGKVMPSM